MPTGTVTDLTQVDRPVPAVPADRRKGVMGDTVELVTGVLDAYAVEVLSTPPLHHPRAWS